MSVLKHNAGLQIANLYKVQMDAFEHTNEQLFFCLLIVFVAATGILIHQKTGWRTTSVVALLTMLSMIVLKIARGYFGFYNAVRGLPLWLHLVATIVVLIGLLIWQLRHVPRARYFNRFLSATAAFANVMAAFLTTYTFVFLFSGCYIVVFEELYGFFLLWEEKTGILTGTFLFYFLFLIPWFQKLYARLNALPEK